MDEPGLIPRVSILMPVFNTARYLAAALDSVGAQSFTDFELIVVDDGSSDGSAELLKRFAIREMRMRLITRENLGVIATRNELLGAARSELVAWMDSDDISLPQRIERQVRTFQDDPALACLGTAAQCVDPDGNCLNVERYPLTHMEILIAQQKGGAMRFPTTMMRRELALRVGGFREPFRIGEDFDLLLRLSEHGKMANLPDSLYIYRQHVASICATLGPRWPAYRDQILQLAAERRRDGKDRLQNGEILHIGATENPDRYHSESRVYLDWAGHAYLNGDFPLAWKYACRAIARWPTSRAAWRMLLRVILSRFVAPSSGMKN
jgi:glycosyltransferase involved in cell wall biosynthesis